MKRSVLTEGHGVPLGAVIAGANRHAMKLGRQTIESLVVEMQSRLLCPSAAMRIQKLQ